ncbi:MAG: DUF4434 domain-containing protein [Acutalibacteraceae bacterium]|nr:DUF4434 domain-containing protein [Acutalibacteraceae bacterium]
MIIVKIISAVIAFIMAVLPFGSTESEKKCESVFNGTFIQSWMSSSWDDERWQQEVENMQEAGIEYLILQDVAEKGSESAGGIWNVYYDSELPDFEGAAFGGNVIEAALRNCENSGIKVFVGLAMFDDFWNETVLSPQYKEVCGVMADMVEEIYGKYGDYECFYGWYFTPEISNSLIRQIYVKGIADGVNIVIDSINNTDESKPLLMSPFSSEYLSAGPCLSLASYVRIINGINFRDGDIFAPQDAVGAKWIKEKNLELTWKMYSEAVKSCDADLKLWANCENFSTVVAPSALEGILNPPATENTVYVTETLDRFIWQMDIASKYAENIITFSYNHYYSPDYANPGFIETYYDYLENGYVLESEAPTAPDGFTAEVTADGTVLSWNAAEDNIGIAYYRIEKDGKFLARIDMVYGWEELTFTDTGKTGEYTITAFDCAGNCSKSVNV